MSDFWEVRIQDIAEVLVSNVDKKSYAGQKAVVLCNYMDVYSNDYISSDLNFMESTASEAEIKKFSLRKGDVVITKDSESPFDIGIPSVVTEDIDDLVCGYHLAIIRPNLDKVDPLFLAKQLSSEKSTRYFARVAAGSTRFGLSIGSIHALPIQITSLEVQKKIGEIGLTIDNQIDATQSLIDKYTAIKQGMMADLFSRGIDPETKALRPTFEEAPELYHKTPLGMLPKGWDATPLRDVCDLQVGYAFKSSEFVSEGVSLLRGENVGYGKPSWKDRKCLSHSAAENYEEYLLGDSDIVIGMDRTFTKSGVKISKILDTDLPCLLVQRVGRFVPFGVVDGLIEHIVFQNHYLRELMVAEQGMDIPHLSKDDILSPLVAIPECPKEAVLLTAVLDNVTGKLHAEQAFLEKMKLQKNGLMQDLLTGKVPVPA